MAAQALLVSLLLLTASFVSCFLTQPPFKRENHNSMLPAARTQIVEVRCQADEPPALRQGVTELFKAYFDELSELGCDLGFQGFQNEWIDLPGKYDFEKRGGLFVAVETPNDTKLDLYNLDHSKHVVGCIAIRPLDEECGEMKRMYIRKSHRRNGIGKLMSKAIVDHAWTIGFSEIKLDSLERLSAAVNLYEAIGFNRIDPYCECPEDDHVCMNLYRE
jgi:GNAT superfamily N-acetyltransferase